MPYRNIRLTYPPMEGPDIQEIENKLISLGFDIIKDSRYTSSDYTAVRVFQELTKIVKDGVIGPQTKGQFEVTTPDNFYPEVFQDIYLTKKYVAAEIDYFLDEFAISSLNDHGKYFVQAEAETGLPVEWQLGNAWHESGDRNSAGKFLLGQSYYGREWKNLFGWAIMDSGPLSEGKFETYQECILTVAHKIKDLFLDPNNWRYHGDHIFGIEVRYSTASYNAIRKAGYYRRITKFLDAGIKTKMPLYVEDLLPILDKIYQRKV